MTEATLQRLCQLLKLPALAREALGLAETAQRQQQPPLAYLCQVLEAEVAE